MGVYEAWWASGPFTVRLDRRNSIWSYSIQNGVGGSSGSTQRGSLKTALFVALRTMPVGTEYRLVVNGQDRGMFTKD